MHAYIPSIVDSVQGKRTDAKISPAAAHVLLLLNRRVSFTRQIACKGDVSLSFSVALDMHEWKPPNYN